MANLYFALELTLTTEREYQFFEQYQSELEKSLFLTPEKASLVSNGTSLKPSRIADILVKFLQQNRPNSAIVFQYLYLTQPVQPKEYSGEFLFLTAKQSYDMTPWRTVFQLADQLGIQDIHS